MAPSELCRKSIMIIGVFHGTECSGTWVFGPLILLVFMLFWGIFNLILKYFQFQFYLLTGFGLVGLLYINLYNYLDYLNITQMKRQNFILFLMWSILKCKNWIHLQISLSWVLGNTHLKTQKWNNNKKNLINISIINIVLFFSYLHWKRPHATKTSFETQ